MLHMTHIFGYIQQYTHIYDNIDICTPIYAYIHLFAYVCTYVHLYPGVTIFSLLDITFSEIFMKNDSLHNSQKCTVEPMF